MGLGLTIVGYKEGCLQEGDYLGSDVVYCDDEDNDLAEHFARIS